MLNSTIDSFLNISQLIYLFIGEKTITGVSVLIVGPLIHHFCSVVCRPAVCLVKMRARSKDGLALVGQVCNIGELMAVELKHGAERLLFIPLSVQAVLYIMHIHEESIDL